MNERIVASQPASRVYKHEKKLFLISLFISIMVWIPALIFLVVYLPFIFLFYIFAQSAFISYIRGTAVKLSPEQFPDLHSRVLESCKKLNIEKVPDAYILNSDGILNALATKFFGRYYIVLYSDIVTALDDRPEAVNFYIGHELGHIRMNHLNWSPVLLPSSWLPLLGAAYSRAREYTCDINGFACCSEQDDAAFALGVLAAGPQRWKDMNIEEYARQSSETGSFWMAFHELTSTYPWLCKRVEQVRAMSRAETPTFAKRNIFSYLLSVFVPNFGLGGNPAGILVSVAIIGILAAVALPAYQEYIITANKTRVLPAFELGNELKESLTPYIIDNSALPTSLSEIGLPDDLSNSVVTSVTITDTKVVLSMNGIETDAVETIEYEPYVSDGLLYWDCTGGTLPLNYRPPECSE